ncbi:radical SAM protein [Candidatus Poribacteria bacterium]
MEKNLYFARLRLGESGLYDKMLDMELTERCNSNCIHCYINLPAADAESRNSELSTEEVKNILKEAAALGYLTVRFTGAEPLLREDFEEIYLFARKLGLKTGICTNGTLINRHMAELFARVPPLSEIYITIYGMKKKSYEAVTRTPGSFDAAWHGVNLLQENGIPFIVRGAFLPPSKEEIEELEAWASTIPWMPGPLTYSMFFDLRGRRDSEVKNRFIKRLRISPEEGLEILTKRGEEYTEEMRQFCSSFTGVKGDKLFTCGAGVTRSCVDAHGYLQPCTLLRHPDVVYDLKNGSIEDALTNFFPKMTQIKASNSDYLTRCARCFLMGLCDQCPAKSWMEHGTLDTPVEYVCEITHAQARYLGLLEDGEMAWEVSNWRERLKEFSDSGPDD